MPEKKLLRVVADTNVLISALIGKRTLVFLDKLKDNQFILIFSEKTFEELILVLKRPKFTKYVTKNDLDIFRTLLSYHSQIITTTERVTECRDQKDNIFLETALAASVDFIVSGDSDLLSLHPFRNIPILTPEEFIRIVMS